MQRLEVRVLQRAICEENKFYEIASIDFEKEQVRLYINKIKGTLITLPFENVLEIRLIKNSLFD